MVLNRNTCRSSASFVVGYDEVENVQIGKYMEIQLSGLSEEEAKVRVQEMCEKLLANTVIESYKFTLDPAQ